MFLTAMIIFREVFEISLIMSFIMIATKGMNNRIPYVISGFIVGFIGSIIIASSTNIITDMVEGMGQEILSSFILLITIAAISWTVIYMQHHSKKISNKISNISKNVITGNSSLYILSFTIATSVLREGAEITLFLYGIMVSGVHITNMIIGGIIGLAMAIIFSIILYSGLIILSPKYLFKITSLLLILLASSMASEIARFLTQADLITIGSEVMWDSSWLISNQSNLGKFLCSIIGYNDSPTFIQLIFYFSTMAMIVLLSYAKK